MKKSLRQAIRTERLYFDGGFGTMVQSRGLPPGTPPELWNIERPEVIEQIHRAYCEAGSNIITANRILYIGLRKNANPGKNNPTAYNPPNPAPSAKRILCTGSPDNRADARRSK